MKCDIFFFFIVHDAETKTTQPKKRRCRKRKKRRKTNFYFQKLICSRFGWAVSSVYYFYEPSPTHRRGSHYAVSSFLCACVTEKSYDCVFTENTNNDRIGRHTFKLSQWIKWCMCIAFRAPFACMRGKRCSVFLWRFERLTHFIFVWVGSIGIE